MDSGDPRRIEPPAAPAVRPDAPPPAPSPDPPHRAAPPPEPPAERPTRRFSRLSVRIMALSIFPVATIFGGLLYAGAYERTLIQAEIASLGTQARMVAAAVAEAAVPPGQPEAEALEARVATQTLERLAGVTRARARLFDAEGKLLADSRALLSPGGAVREEELPSDTTRRWLTNRVIDVYDWFFNLLAQSRERTPPYREKADESAADFVEVKSALAGDPRSYVRRARQGYLVLFYAAPIQRYKKVHGAVLLSSTSLDIDRSVREVRLDILRIITVVTIFTVMLSFYLARSIARPINRLAAAADQMRRGRTRQVSIPDFTARQDEIGDLSASLTELTNDLWRRLDAIEAFAADVAHEIKNPLASLRSAIETLGKLKDPEKQKRLMDMIRDDVDRLDRLISDISRASRLDSELSRFQLEPVDVGRLLATLADVQATTGKPGEALVRVIVPASPPLVARAVEDRLVQVFQNIIANAVSFSPPGGVITATGAVDGDHVRVTVDDQGPGIPPGKERDIFKRFYSERPAGEKFGRHSGLGLSISQQIVEAMGGTIHAENLPGAGGSETVGGARFVVRLPRVRTGSVERRSGQRRE
jgi:two-component system, OmpR family, sensor histidine kinase ChvG